jgi:hypothetical protein
MNCEMGRINFYLMVFVGACLASACKNTPAKVDNGMQEIRVSDKLSNADIIRNPVSIDNKDTVNVAKMSFVESVFNYGTVVQGTVVEHVFKFTNTGKAPMLIVDVKSSCGCTIADFNKGAIAPGQSDQIKVHFDTTDKDSIQVKEVVVVANTIPSKSIVTLKGYVGKKR